MMEAEILLKTTKLDAVAFHWVDISLGHLCKLDCDNGSQRGREELTRLRLRRA